MKDKAIEVIYSAIDDLNEQLSADRKLDKNPETVLLGSGGKIDSVSFINFIVLLEEKCQDKFGVPVCLTGEAVAMDDSYPFRNVGTLVEHICKLVEEQPQAS
jgi:acyl carrier protein